ncbi:16S rRNA (guanine(527)-N(7))-methyltransferase RsmG [Porcipelethomonas sp.]|uniref:16S rRNA (guanine(527)-N(7))-methyltransferase RsmG n=1 Tax=Porcipelethomonas sp. TaxID=2981675 RepID=UPI003EF8F1D2
MVSFKQCESLFVENGLNYSEKLHEKLSVYCDFLIEYNKKINLTAITDPEEIWVKHFLDSILLDKYVNIPENASFIDVGTGAGFPSVPLKLYREDIQITLLDSLNKRIKFLDELCQRLEIKAVTIHSRAEDAAKNAIYREKFDVAAARAVAAMPVLSEYCMGFVKKGGIFAAMKGPNEKLSDSKNAIEMLGGKVSDEIEYKLNSFEHRKIFIVEKISQTSLKYPRNSSQIKNKPL